MLSARDHALRGLREEANFSKLLSACPMHAPILGLAPISPMLAAAGISDRLRRIVICTAPVVSGLLTVGDSWACTNPSLGRGITVGLLHALAAAEAVDARIDDPAALAVEHDRLTRKRVLPWYQATTQVDRMRAAQVAAAIEGRPPAPVPASPEVQVVQDVSAAMMVDADAFRAFLELTFMLALPEDLVSRPGFADHVRNIAAALPPARFPGPTRQELLAMLAVTGASQPVYGPVDCAIDPLSCCHQRRRAYAEVWPAYDRFLLLSAAGVSLASGRGRGGARFPRRGAVPRG